MMVGVREESLDAASRIHQAVLARSLNIKAYITGAYSAVNNWRKGLLAYIWGVLRSQVFALKADTCLCRICETGLSHCQEMLHI